MEDNTRLSLAEACEYINEALGIDDPEDELDRKHFVTKRKLKREIKVENISVEKKDRDYYFAVEDLDDYIAIVHQRILVEETQMNKGKLEDPKALRKTIIIIIFFFIILCAIIAVLSATTEGKHLYELILKRIFS